MKKRVLKHGGKSGLLPKVRPVFKRNPLVPKTEEERAEYESIEQGYAEGVPLPLRTGFKFERKPVERPVVTLEERIKRNIEDYRPKVEDESKLSESEKWALKRDQIRREYLREAYVTEAARLEKLEQAKRAQAKRAAEAKNATTTEDDSPLLTIPTIDSYLQGPLMRPRTEEENFIIQEQRRLNRKHDELRVKEKKATELLELYHAADKFITTEEELSEAITQAFEVDVGKFETTQSYVEDKLFGHNLAYAKAQQHETTIFDKALGTINDKPGLQLVKDTLSGRTEKLRSAAELALNQKHV